jgi:hypothetical protein
MIYFKGCFAVPKMYKQTICLLSIAAIGFSDQIVLKDEVSSSADIVDTVGCAIIVSRNDNTIRIEKDKILFVVLDNDTVYYNNFICTEDARNKYYQPHALLSKHDEPKSFVRNDTLYLGSSRSDTVSINQDSSIKLFKKSRTVFNAPMMTSNGMWTGGGSSTANDLHFSVNGVDYKVGFLGSNLRPHLVNDSSALSSLSLYQGQKIGSIVCYAGCATSLLVALFAGQEKTGESYGYDPQTGSFGNTSSYKTTPIFVPSIVLSALLLPTGLILQFTANRHVYKAVKIHNEQVLKK